MIKCSGCGSKIPFNGEVCPFCQRDKGDDKSASVVAGVALSIGGFFGYLIGDFTGMIIGALVLGIPVVTIVTLATSGKNHSARKPPRVRVDPPTPPPVGRVRITGPASASVEDRLRRLDRLKADGLITDDEHKAQRGVIVATL